MPVAAATRGVAVVLDFVASPSAGELALLRRSPATTRLAFSTSEGHVALSRVLDGFQLAFVPVDLASILAPGPSRRTVFGTATALDRDGFVLGSTSLLRCGRADDTNAGVW